MGYIMMNWSSELIMQVKSKRKRRRDDESEQEIEDTARPRAEEEQMRIDEHKSEFYWS